MKAIETVKTVNNYIKYLLTHNLSRGLIEQAKLLLTVSTVYILPTLDQ